RCASGFPLHYAAGTLHDIYGRNGALQVGGGAERYHEREDVRWWLHDQRAAIAGSRDVLSVSHVYRRDHVDKWATVCSGAAFGRLFRSEFLAHNKEFARYWRFGDRHRDRDRSVVRVVC